jgi:hypothetical protein
MELPLLAYSLVNKLNITKTHGHFADRFSAVSVSAVTCPRTQFAAFVYMCKLNLDLDGAPTTYGYDNPAKDSAQKNLDPLESWRKGGSYKGHKVSHLTSEKVGLANACGSPGDGSKGTENFLNGTRNFYWAGLKAVTRKQAAALNLVVDDRAELEAGLETYSKHPVLLPVGSGYFPVVQANGYYISGTSVAADTTVSALDPAHYLSSPDVPYAVWANNWNHLMLGGKKLQLGDFGLAIQNDTGANTGFVYGDSGTPDKVGESSQKLHTALGKGAGLVTFIAFPGSGSGPALGRNPESLIPGKVRIHTQKLGASAPELAARLAMGREMRVPPKPIDQIPISAGLYKNFMSALKVWTTVP